MDPTNGGKAVSFTGLLGAYNLQSSNFLTEHIGHNNEPDKDVNIIKLARSHGVISGGVKYSEKHIPLKGSIIGSSVSDVESRVDEFLRYVSGDGTLDIGQGGSTRRYDVEVGKIVVTETRALFERYITMEFITMGWGYATSTTTLVSGATFTSDNYNQSLTFTGSAPEQWPIITLTLDSVTPDVLNTVTIANNATGQSISISRLWAATDEVVITTKLRRIAINGVVSDASGVVPYFLTGTQTLNITHDFSAASFTLDVTNVDLYK